MGFINEFIHSALLQNILTQLLSHPWMVLGVAFFILPTLALLILNPKLKVPSSAFGTVRKDPEVDQLESAIIRALRQVSRETQSSFLRDEAQTLLLQLQARLRFAEASLRQMHESHFTKLLVEAARLGITVTPGENRLHTA